MDEVSKDKRNPQRGGKKQDIFKSMNFLLISRKKLEQFNFLIL